VLSPSWIWHPLGYLGELPEEIHDPLALLLSQIAVLMPYIKVFAWICARAGSICD
jgi:hypothetical protein